MKTGQCLSRRKAGYALLAPLALFFVLPSAAARQDDAYGPGWSAVHADPANSDYHPRPGPSDLTLGWSRSFDGMINLGPTSDGKGRVYVTTSGAGCRLHALDRATGKTIWCSDTVGRLAVSSRVVSDFSMGGYGALKLSLLAPRRYRAVAALFAPGFSG